jgi:long-chain acyl-CoA synthetase
MLADHQHKFSGPTLARQLDAECNALSNTLHNPARHVVGLLADNGCAWATADLALMRAGYATVPMPLFFSHSQLQHVVNHAAVDVILTDRASLVQSLEMGFKPTPAPLPSGLTMLRRQHNSANALPSGTQKVTFTSGTTGQPKGVCLSSEHLQSVTDSIATTVSQLELHRHLCMLPLPTLLENVAGLYTAVAVGAECVLLPAEIIGTHGPHLNPKAALKAIDDYRPSSLILVPQLLLMLVSAAELGWQVPDSLRFIAVGGARVSVELLGRAKRVGLPVYEGYGLSECGSVLSLNRPGENRIGSCGQPLSHVGLKIARDGEIMVQHPVMLGYAGAEAYNKQPFATGDLGRLDDDGYLYIDGRKKDIFINAFGRNISPSWVEAELTQEAEIASAAVFGEARPFNVALISSDSPTAAISAAVQRANARLPDYARVCRWDRSPKMLSTKDGSLSATGEPRRTLIAQRYHDLLETLYTATSDCA